MSVKETSSIDDLQQINNAADKTESIGNKCFEEWEETRNLNMARTGISAFKTVLYAKSLVIRMKQVLGR